MTFVQTRTASRAYFPNIGPNDAAKPEWIVRGGSFVVAYARAEAGAVLERSNPDEYFVFLPDATAVIEAGGAKVEVGVRSLTVVPPGDSRLTLTSAGQIVRVFSAEAHDLTSSAINADVYVDGADELAPVRPWPTPADGWKLRSYALDDYLDRKFRLFRSTNLMINIFDLEGPRDPTALTPHSHADFEQGSLALGGEWMHDLRYPWGPRLTEWREDEHLAIGSPSLLVIPATVIHTSRAVGDGRSQLVDIFCPPRRDFSEMGLVCNADDYPMPDADG
jgi:hypothetical protein